MHRSGTSCLTGCLEQAGLFLGIVNREAPFNKKGNNESLAVMNFNDRVLARVGATWDRPPNVTVALTPAEETQLRALVGTYPAGVVWGLKDPRLLLLFDAWDREVRPRLVGTIRHPAEVVASLIRRARIVGRPMGESEAYGLWQNYNERLLTIHRVRPFPLVRFDQDPDTYQNAVSSIARTLGLPGNAKLSFFESGMRTRLNDDASMPDSLKALWTALLSRTT
jgi:hypothetical protein